MPVSLQASLPPIEEKVPLSRLTTVGIGGPARALARPRTLAQLERALAWAAERGLPVVPIGLGSNVLASDEGIEALVVRLEGELATVAVEGECLLAGGGAANAVCLHRARAAGLGGLEFACAIPGTVGGGVKMNAGAYGSDFAAIVRRAFVVSPDGGGWLSRQELALSYRRSSLAPGQVVAKVEVELRRSSPEEVKSAIGRLNAQRKASQPTSARTFGSVFKNPDHDLSAGRMLDLCGLRGCRVGGARISPVHANFIENVGGARAADALLLMAEARRRALESFGVVLEREVELLGLELPPPGALP
ncbi:MAG: hypothetical protein C4305_09385 [Thermoleophilia bacterium]